LKFVVQDPYSNRVRGYFVNPVHAGNLQKSYSAVVSATADDRQGNTIQLAAGIDGDTLQELRFRALACPHLIAAAEYFCGRFEGRTTMSLREFDPWEMVRELQIPPSKTGRILLLEDVIKLLRQKIGDDSHS
jgi:NifU-like protein involved in Fe-S cluster formation